MTWSSRLLMEGARLDLDTFYGAGQKVPMPKKLPLDFYQRSTRTVARELLGKVLVHEIKPGVRLSGRIVETEAYLGLRDPACHSFGPRRTPRTEVMFKSGGYAYVYFIYGMYFCFNVVTEKSEVPEAVLVRALEPMEGTALMTKVRDAKTVEQLCSGPGKLCLSLAITKKQNGLALNGSSIWIEDAKKLRSSEIVTCQRIGIAQPSAKDWPYRYYVKGSKCISKSHSPRM